MKGVFLMKTICIKTNNQTALTYLLNELHMSELENVCFSQNQFKNYKNIIIHYKGPKEDDFIQNIANMLSYYVIDELEETLLKDIINQNYFYFDAIEKKKILDFCFDICSEDFTTYFDKKFSYLSEQFYLYLKDNKSIVLTGFIYFRLKKYFEILDEIVEESVNSFIIEKEYLEFISLLKLYINSQSCKTAVVHIVYFKDNPILLDESKTPIPISDEIPDAKYLSDISFSKNDYILNTLLNLLPKKIYVHLVEHAIDEFLNTLILIFEKRIELCSDCNICSLYENHSKVISSQKEKT